MDTTYSERNAPPHVPAGADIPKGVRLALLSWLSDLSLDDPPKPTELWKRLRHRVGYGEGDDVVEDVEQRFGREAAERVAEAFADEMRVRRASPPSSHDRYAIPALKSVPAPLFLDALEIAIGLLRQRPRLVGGLVIEYDDESAIAEFNRLFALRGISYRFNAGGEAEWHGDQGAYEQVVAPALAALADPRLAAAAREFEHALKALRQGGYEGDKNAVRDASNAVEAAMKTVLDEHNVTRTGNETATPLWELLNGAGIVDGKTQEPVCAAPRLGNTHGRHGPNPQADPVPPGIPELAVQTAAAAIVYLASLLR